jgi:hypothetical protein
MALSKIFAHLSHRGPLKRARGPGSYDEWKRALAAERAAMRLIPPDDFEDEPDEPPEPDGEAYRGGEAAAALAESQAHIQRMLK